MILIAPILSMLIVNVLSACTNPHGNLRISTKKRVSFDLPTLPTIPRVSVVCSICKKHLKNLAGKSDFISSAEAKEMLDDQDLRPHEPPSKPANRQTDRAKACDVQAGVVDSKSKATKTAKEFQSVEVADSKDSFQNLPINLRPAKKSHFGTPSQADQDDIKILSNRSCVVCTEKFQRPRKNKMGEWQYELVEMCPHCKNFAKIECFERWLAESLTCPWCREEVRPARKPRLVSPPPSPSAGAEDGALQRSWSTSELQEVHALAVRFSKTSSLRSSPHSTLMNPRGR